jgi:flagellin
MSTVVNTNLASLFAQNSLTNAQNNLATSVQRLSSGLRINSAKDDAAGLAIAQNMQSQLNGTNQSIQNLNDATNLLQTADSSLSTIQDLLLRLKQLATQGYDGSLNGTQKLDILQQMQDLNTEINATAARTQFNGISLLSSGASLDQSNSDIKVGTNLTNAPVAVATTTGTLGAKIGTTLLADTAVSYINGGSVSNTAASSLTSVALDPTLLNSTPGSYTITSAADQLTMSGTFNGTYQTQTITIQAAQGNALGGSVKNFDRAYDFSNFGITLNVNQKIDAGKVETGTQLAYALAGNNGSGTTLTVNGKTGSISAVNLTGTAAGTYQITQGTTGQATLATTTSTVAGGAAATLTLTLSSGATGITTNGIGSGATLQVVEDAGGSVTGVTVSGGSGYNSGDTITIRNDLIGGTANASTTFTVGGILSDSLLMTGTVNGIATTQQVSVAAQLGGQKETLNFSSFGIAMDVTSYQNQTGNDISTKIVAANGGTPSTPGQIVVNQGQNSNLQFQSGPSSTAFIAINTANVLTGTSGSNVGNQSAMTNVGTVISGSGTGNLGGLQATDTTATWQDAFQNAAGYVDAAVDYISTLRTQYGSQMNRLSYISTNLTAQSTNLQQSKSAIMDTNFASETASLTKGQIMQQAATAMLAQANQMPNVILSLLK